jgi:atypical dual specificity phosphatase
MTEISKGVYMSDLTTAYDVKTLSSYRISHIVSVMPGLLDLPNYPSSQLLQIPVEDMPFAEILSYLDSSVRWIDRALKGHPDARVLIHCYKGASRSATVACAYLMKTKRWSMNESLTHIQSRRPSAEPNFGFVMQLKEFEKSL